MENWQTVLFDSMKNDGTNKYIVAIYYILWIFIGNFILLNLFLAILLDSFLEDDDEIMDQQEIEEAIKRKRKRAADRKKRQNAKKVFMPDGELVFDTEIQNFGEQIESEEDLEDLDEE